MPLVVTCCTKRKRGRIHPDLEARALPSGSAGDVAQAWSARLRAADTLVTASDLYAGRGHVEARRAATSLGAPLVVLSAGLGLVSGDRRVPAYSLTTIGGDIDDIRLKTGSDRSAWWAEIQKRSPFNAPPLLDSNGLILAAVSSAYLDMVASDWNQWPAADIARLRIFSATPPSGVAEPLRAAWMPYDDRLNAVGDGIAGTRGDFAQRAMRHFATKIRSGSQQDDAAAVLEILKPFDHPVRPSNKRLDDAAITAAIREDWATVHGQSAAMLRHLRGTRGLACEQSRFRTLFNAVKAETAP